MMHTLICSIKQICCPNYWCKAKNIQNNTRYINGSKHAIVIFNMPILEILHCSSLKSTTAFCFSSWQTQLPNRTMQDVSISFSRVGSVWMPKRSHSNSTAILSCHLANISHNGNNWSAMPSNFIWWIQLCLKDLLTNQISTPTYIKTCKTDF